MTPFLRPLLFLLPLIVRLGAAAQPEHPNVLFIAVDDLRTALRCYGDATALSPSIDRLAARGTLFTRAYAQQAVCNPSRQSLLSGRRPDSIRVWDLNRIFRNTAPDVVPLPEHFKIHGYFAQAFGKIYHGTKGMSDPQSWSVPEQFAHESKRDDYLLEENRKPTKGGKAAALEFVGTKDEEYGDGQVAAAAVEALRGYAKTPERPFFLAVGFRKPHLPFTAPKKYWDLYDKVNIPPIEVGEAPAGAPELALHASVELRGYQGIPKQGVLDVALAARLRRGYYAAMSFTDAQIGKLLDALEAGGFAANTVVVLWGDHGFHLGEHGLWAKTTNYEADVRSPLIVAAPGKRPGVRTAALVEFVDLYPTLVELCGLPARAKLDGKSFAANLGDPAAPGKAGALSQFPRPWASGKNFRPEYMGYTVRTATHRYVEWRRMYGDEVVARELYAYEGDELFERENLAGRPASQELMARLAALLPKSPAKE